MPTLIPDTVAAAESMISPGGSYAVRSFLIKNPDVSMPQDVMVQALAAAGLPQVGESLSSRYPLFICRRHAFAPQDNAGKFLRVRVWYELFASESRPIETFVAEYSSSLLTDQSQLMPITKAPFRVSLPPDNTEEETATLTIQQPLRVLSLFGLFNSPISSNVMDAEGAVNSDTFQGRPPGHWLCNSVRVRFSDLEGMWSARVEFISKAGEDWRSWAVIRDTGTGQFYNVPQATIDAQLALPYTFGIQYQQDGLLVAGTYEALPFSAIFGLP